MVVGAVAGRYFLDIYTPFGAFMIGPPVDLSQVIPDGLFFCFARTLSSAKITFFAF
jgi:hypothetical protein